MRFTIDFVIVFAIAIFALSLVGANGQDQPNIENLVAQYGTYRNTIEMMPYHVTLECEEDIVCEGAIISTNYVLTAAQCMVDDIKELLVRAGTQDRGINGSLHHVDQFIPYDNSSDIPNDGKNIAVIHVIEAFNIDPFRNPVALFRADQRLQPTSVLDISSFGETNAQLEQVNVPLVKKTQCNQKYGTTPPDTFCAGYRDTQINFGMTGSPVLVNLQLAGIMSVPIGCEQNPGVITYVSMYRDWISRVAHLN